MQDLLDYLLDSEVRCVDYFSIERYLQRCGPARRILPVAHGDFVPLSLSIAPPRPH
jgi:hypothetical protein